MRLTRRGRPCCDHLTRCQPRPRIGPLLLLCLLLCAKTSPSESRSRAGLMAQRRASAARAGPCLHSRVRSGPAPPARPDELADLPFKMKNGSPSK